MFSTKKLKEINKNAKHSFGNETSLFMLFYLSAIGFNIRLT